MRAAGAAGQDAGMIELTDDMHDRLASALSDGCPVVAASVDADGQAHLSFYGTTQVYGPDQLAIWVRDPAASFLKRIAGNPKVALLYRNGAERVMYQFHGLARPVDDEDVRQQVFEHSPEVERSLDPDRHGVAVLIHVDRVRGRLQREPVEMDR
jgi:hypothetical protein